MKRCQQGFTLVEIILYVGIFSLIIGGIVGLATLSIAERTKNEIRADLDYQGQAVMANISQTIRQAKTVTFPTAGNNGANLILQMTDSAIDPTTFYNLDKTSYHAIAEQEGSPATENQLTNSRITLSNLKFTNMSVGSTANSVLVQFTLTYHNQLNRAEFDYSQDFSGGATIP